VSGQGACGEEGGHGDGRAAISAGEAWTAGTGDKAAPNHLVGMKTDRIPTYIINIVFIFIFVFEYRVRYG